jgi:hypothetical protein
MKKYVTQTNKFTDVEVWIVKGLVNGLNQKQISAHVKMLGYSPCSLKTIETRIRQMKKAFKVKTMFQLGVTLAKKEKL